MIDLICVILSSLLLGILLAQFVLTRSLSKHDVIWLALSVIFIIWCGRDLLVK